MNAVQTLKSINLLIVCCSASENTKEQAQKVASKYHCPMIITNEIKLEQITFKENSKVMAITDKSLAKAILDNCKNDFTQKN